jgi:hypothetical protein
VEVLPAQKDGNTEVHQARFLDGNVKQFKAVWTLTKVDDARSDVRVPAPADHG